MVACPTSDELAPIRGNILLRAWSSVTVLAASCCAGVKGVGVPDAACPTRGDVVAAGRTFAVLDDGRRRAASVLAQRVSLQRA